MSNLIYLTYSDIRGILKTMRMLPSIAIVTREVIENDVEKSISEIADIAELSPETIQIVTGTMKFMLTHMKILKLISKLKDREITVLTMRYLTEKRLPWKEVAVKTGYSLTRVKEIDGEAIKKLTELYQAEINLKPRRERDQVNDCIHRNNQRHLRAVQ